MSQILNLYNILITIKYLVLQTGLEKGPECNVLSPIQTMDRAWDTVFVGTRTGFVLQFECKV